MHNILNAVFCSCFFLIIKVYYCCKGGDYIQIEIKPRSKVKEFFHKIHNKLEDILFSIFQKIPERLIPQFLMNWLEHYTIKRINELKQQTIKQTWTKLELDKAVNEISNRQQNK